MSTDDTEQSPFTRPAFVWAAIVVGLVLVLGAILAVHAMTTGKTTASPPAASGRPTAATSTPSPSTGASQASVCGLSGTVMAGTLSKAPAATWAYEGTTAYPTSDTYGPGKTDANGVRYCFQHTPAGAVFAAANAVVQGSDSAVSGPWAKYVVADGQYRTELLSQVGTPSSTQGTRTTIAGFRVLDYDGTHATIDLAVTASTQGKNVTVSAVYSLIWQGGDWKISADVAKPLDIASIPDLAGYVSWGA